MNINNSSNRPRIRRGNNQFLDNGVQSASPPRLKTTYSEYLAIKKNLAKRLHSRIAATYDFDDGHGVICFRCEAKWLICVFLNQFCIRINLN